MDLGVRKALFLKGMIVFLAAHGKSITHGELEADPIVLLSTQLRV